MKYSKWVVVLAVAISFLVGAFTVDKVEAGKSGSKSYKSTKSSVHVKGYFRKDGTYVAPHYRSAPDKNPYNNWSYPGNTNSYTGKTATADPQKYLDNYYSKDKYADGERVWVNGYYKADGTWVSGHWRTAPHR